VGDMLVARIALTDLHKYLADLQDRPGRIAPGISSHTVHKGYSTIRTFIRALYHQGQIPTQLTDFVRPIRLSDDLPECLTPAETERLLVVARAASFRNLVIFEFFLDTGCRLSEVAGLDLEDIALEAGWAKIYGKGRREALVPLGRVLVRDLYQYITQHRDAEAGEDALFTNIHGRRLGMEGMSMMVKRAMAAADVSGKRGAHKLRHTFATEALRNGMPLESVRKILRHRDIKVTQRYLHLTQGDVQEDHRQASPLDRWSRSGRLPR